MTGPRLFLAKLKARPRAALGGLAVNYATYVAMVVFFIWLWVLRWPVWLIERVLRRHARKAIIDAVARIAHG